MSSEAPQTPQKRSRSGSIFKDDYFPSSQVEQTRRWSYQWIEVRTVSGKVKIPKWVSDQPRQLADPHICQICQKELSSSIGLKRHMKIHNEKKLSCDFDGCTEMFEDNAKLLVHQEVMGHVLTIREEVPVEEVKVVANPADSSNTIPNSQMPQMCHVCKRMLSCCASLRKHMKRHPDADTDCLVEGCGMKFSNAYRLNQHITRSHPEEVQKSKAMSEDKPSSCEECAKVFANETALRKHRRIHGEERFLCYHDGCGKKFTDNVKLLRHARLEGHKVQ